MRKVLRSLRSPAVVISILALVAGITGAAVAGPIASTSKLTKKDKKQVRKIADNEINKLVPTLTAKSVGPGGVTQTAFQKKLAVSIDLPPLAGGDCDTLDVPGLTGVSGTSAIIMTPPSEKPVGWTTLAGHLNSGGVYLDFCNIDGFTSDPDPGTYVFDVIAP